MRNIQSSLFLIAIVLSVSSCGKGQGAGQSRKVNLDKSGEVTVLVTGVENAEAVRKEAQGLSIDVEGTDPLILKGEADRIEDLHFIGNSEFEFMEDAPVTVEEPEPFSVKTDGLYLAKKDLGVLELLKSHPTADGRGVKVGVIDDGISPHQHGFILTSSGERKFLKKASRSSFSTFSLKETEGGWEAVVDETRPSFSGTMDLNANGTNESWKIFVPAAGDKVCLDVNADSLFAPEECKGTFAKTGEYIHAHDPRLVLMTELNLEKKEVQVFQPERESHGEGVATVLAGHRMGNLAGFDGVAPGAQILDWDVSEFTDKPEEREYTIASFIKALNWMASEGAEVVNISYSFFFASARTQDFMNKAVAALIKKHNMVISFSAGNNGPGLGSLNRRHIYPSSALVAGAYISKELDERVHGVTGIPEEGRVVFYSSRGPGLGMGPVLIAPLSSLTNSSPTSGHMAFNGTSSAAPALAGAATVLISAIKQAGLKVDAATVVHALRLSGRKLKNEPFIAQGYGLPQVDQAFALYSALIKGEEFMDVSAVTDRDHVDGIASRGAFIRTSLTNGITSRRITLTGVISEAASADAKVNLLTPIRLEYSRGIKGPRELWISSAASNLAVDIDPEEILGSSNEGFGEIRIVSQRSNRQLAIVPITVVRDLSVRGFTRTILSAGAQEGVRLPLNVPQGVKGFKVRSKVLEGDERTFVLSAYNNHGIRTHHARVSSEVWVSTLEPGFYQVAVTMNGGTERKLSVELELEELSFDLRTVSTNASEPTLTIANSGSAASGTVRLRPLHTIVERMIVSSADLETKAQITRDLTEGKYALDFRLTNTPDLSFNSASCSTILRPASGASTLGITTSFDVPKEGANTTVKCVPFDLGGTFEEAVHWEMRLLRMGTPQDIRADWPQRQSKVVKFGKLDPGRYSVEVVDPFSDKTLSLGQVDLI